METAWRENIILVLSVVCLLSTGPICCSNLPLLSGTLKTMHVQACDGEEIKIKCWPNTLISIYSARYGRSVDSKHKCSVENGAPEDLESECAVPTALKVVEAKCREKRVCDIAVDPETFGDDPCPGRTKHLAIGYKCRPNTFFNKVACESQKMRLRCHKTLKIVIYSAMFGATVKSIPECPHLPGLPGEDCQASYATETVMASCHGKKRCSLSVDLATFGNPGCKQGTRLFLKVVYTCVPQAILKDLEIGTDSDKDTEEDGDYPSSIEDPHLDGLSSTTPLPRGYTTPKRPPDGLDRDASSTSAPDVQSDGYATEETTDNCTTIESEPRAIGFLTEWISAYTFVKANREKFILYLTLSLGAGLLAFLVVLAGRLYFQRQRERKRAKLHITDPLPSVFDDTAEMDHYESSAARHHENSVEAVRYTNRSTMSRQDSDSHPRAPLSHNYYYS